ncbi:2',3'-cyclic-nucleotide 3'-phosphodiesterase [Truncatella angustata]|uniref:2',3'-cyclic-nucleotide 3'-phosphodiesterase n=1 Tax=Truncatella angustata TaxID=152316 RepID=A0A9P8UBW7_9PEZI|nr:2',3'-cyclic-nucleotide 3'-phosphodiesterase [Truncatella angustata]KAH6645951.1 2',3'-cyclic-nucleotide 3'-phosphodiesterase [Truncatella angustata]KAH8205330.1 hypothetical protein TruAng_000577 [Truncatella angustata]
MPGSSLWLAPPSDHPYHEILSELITKSLPSEFPSVVGPPFSPHMTLTSNIDPSVYGDNPQQWLDSIPWPTGDEVKILFRGIRTGDVFFRRGYIKVYDTEPVKSLAGLARARGVEGEDSIGPKTEKWLKEWTASFGPHVSLIYGGDPIDDTKLAQIGEFCGESGLELQGGGWKGGVVWLVPTDKPINQWKPIATKTL